MTLTESRNDLEMINKLRTLYQIARNEKRSRYENRYRNYRLVHNKFSSRSSGTSVQPQPRDSEIFPIISSLVGWMTDQRTNIDLTPAADPYSLTFQRMAELANDMDQLVESIWYSEFFDQQIKLMIWDALQFNVGFLKVCWDQQLAGGQGNAVFRRVDPWNMYVDPNATSLNDAEFIIEARRMSLDEIERRWPGNSAAVEASSMLGDIDERPKDPANMSRMPKANPGPLSPATFGIYGKAKSNFDDGYNPLATVVVYEFWIKENSEHYDDPQTPEEAGNTRPADQFPTAIPDKFVEAKWRVIVLAAGCILMDEYAEDLYSHGRHPYVRYVFEDIGDFYGVALVDHLADPQIYVNRLLASLQQNAELCGNPIFLEGSNSGIERTTIVNKPGQRLKLNGSGAMQNPPRWLEPPNMPVGIQQLIEFWINRMENISGLSPAAKGNTNVTRTAEGVMQQAQEAAFVRVRSALRNLEFTLCEATQLLCDLIIDNYTEPRIVAIIGEEGAKGTKMLNYRHFWVGTDDDAMPLKYSIIVQAGASAPTNRQARIAEADKGYAMGTVDRIGWYQAHQTPNWQEMNERIEEAIKAGLFQPPGARQKQQRTS